MNINLNVLNAKNNNEKDDSNLQNKKKFYIEEIDKICKESYNNEQKELAKFIIENSNENNIDSLYTFITQRIKLGFVFDAAPEVNHSCISLAKYNEKLSFTGDVLNKENNKKQNHKLIIGENYDGLKNLLATYTKNGKGLVNMIYIDPPYNTESSRQDGNDYKDNVEASKFCYRDKFTRTGWLNMMNERLSLAKKLLSDDGVIFISIDDTEQAYLKVLCDQIFGEENFVGNILWNNKRKGSYLTNKIVTITEYVLCYSKNLNIKLYGEKLQESTQPIIKRTNNISILTIPANVINTKLQDGIYQAGKYGENGAIQTELLDDVIVKGGKIINTFKMKSNFVWSQNFFNSELKKGSSFFINTKNFQLIVNRKYNEEHYKGFLNLIELNYNNKNDEVSLNLIKGKYNKATSEDAFEELDKIFNKKNVFDYSKPVELIKILIKSVINASENKNSIILDFFAGSGTTGQAVMELNEEDGGNRQCILITNNENNIGINVCRERLYRVVIGKGTKGETFDWKYSENKPYLKDNLWDVFELENNELKIDDFNKAKKLLEEAKRQFKILNSDYEAKDFDIYNQLSSLKPFKKD